MAFVKSGCSKSGIKGRREERNGEEEGERGEREGE
jgi:hypothetical protein